MNILITAPDLNPSKNVSGIATVVKTIIEYNIQHRYFHYLLGRPDKSGSRIKWFVQLCKQLLAFPCFVKRHKIELVHQNLPFDPKGLIREYIISGWCRLLRIPVVLHVHGGEFLMNGTQKPLYQFIAKTLFKHSKEVVVLSNIEQQALQNLYGYSSATLLANSVDTSKYKAKNKIFNQSKPVLLFLGRITESKGIEDIVEAFILLKNKLDFRFILCGAGPLENYFKIKCKEILDGDFEFRGVVSGREKINVINTADFFILPSRYGEGLPMALLETMAAGVVPVVTDDASMKFVIQNEINGMLVEKQNPRHLYSQLEKVTSDKNLYQKLSYNAVATVTAQYDISNYVIQLNDIYSKAIKT
jgi:glycosyltransferase involved in cell wall biosynthesis